MADGSQPERDVGQEGNDQGNGTESGRPLIVLVTAILALLGSWLVPEPLLTTKGFDGVKPWCLTGTVETRDVPHSGCPASIASAESKSDAAPTPTVAQLRSRELAARFRVGIADYILRFASVAAMGLALLGIWSTPGHDGDRARTAAYSVLVLSTVVAVAAAATDVGGDKLRKALLDDLFTRAAMAGTAVQDTIEVFHGTVFWNLLFCYVACGSLLTLMMFLAAQTSKVDRAASVSSRLVLLQAVMLVGAVLFSASTYANSQLIGWAQVFLEQPAMKEAAEVLNRLPELWGVFGSALLVVTVGTTYWAIREDDEAAPNPEGSAIAFRTPGGQDLKFLGWLVNVLLAVFPIWTALSATKFPSFPP